MPVRPPDFLLKRNPGPQYYRMTCPQCGYDREFELAKNYTVILNPDCDHSNDPEIVEELPSVCPVCGAKLNKEKLPVMLRY